MKSSSSSILFASEIVCNRVCLSGSCRTRSVSVADYSKLKTNYHSQKPSSSKSPVTNILLVQRAAIHYPPVTAFTCNVFSGSYCTVAVLEKCIRNGTRPTHCFYSIVSSGMFLWVLTGLLLSVSVERHRARRLLDSSLDQPSLAGHRAAVGRYSGVTPLRVGNE